MFLLLLPHSPFYSKAKFQVAFFKRLSPCLFLSERFQSLLLSSSLPGAVWPLLTSHAHNTLNVFLKKEHESSCMADLFWFSLAKNPSCCGFFTEACDCRRPHWTSLCCVKTSALNLNLLMRSNPETKKSEPKNWSVTQYTFLGLDKNLSVIYFCAVFHLVHAYLCF